MDETNMFYILSFTQKKHIKYNCHNMSEEIICELKQTSAVKWSII